MAALNNIIAGLQVLLKYENYFAAEHDQIWAGGPKRLPAEEKKILEDAGWFWDGDVESWSHFA